MYNIFNVAIKSKMISQISNSQNVSGCDSYDMNWPKAVNLNLLLPLSLEKIMCGIMKLRFLNLYEINKNETLYLYLFLHILRGFSPLKHGKEVIIFSKFDH